MQVRTALRLAAFCLAGSIFVGSVTAKATRDDRLKRQYEYGYSQPIGAISVYSPPEALRTCAPTDVTWQWTGDVTITNTVAIYIQSVALSTIAKRDAGSHQAQACSGAKRMHKMRRGAEANLDSNAASQHLEARADSRLLAADVSLVGQSWEWDSVNVNPGVYRYVVVMQQGSTSPAIYGRSPIFAVVAGSDASCLGSGVAAGMPTTSSAITWGVAPVSSTSSSSSSTTASAPSGVSTPAPVSSETSSPSTGMTLATGNPAASSTNASVPPAESVVNSSTGSSGGVHGGVIAAVVILPLAALIALGMGLFYILKKRREGSNGPYLRSTPSFDALHGAGSTSAGAGTWANRFLASGASRNGGMVNGENTFAELDAEKSGDNRASVFSDLYGGMGETADQFAAMRSTASAVSVSGRPSMADVSLADTPYIYCHSVTTVAQTPNPGSARPSMNSVRGLPISSPMPLHVEDRPAQGTSFDLPRGASSTAGQETVTSPTDSERAFSAGGWPRYANVGKEDVEGAHALTRDEVDTMVVHTPASVGDDATAARKNGLPPLPPSLGARLSTIQGSRGSYVSGPFDNSFQGEAAPSPSLPSHEREMPYPDTPRPYSVKRVSGSTAGHGRFEAGPSSPSPPSMPTVDQRRRGSAGAVTATQPSFPPRSASSMSGKYVNSASGREPGAGPSSPYATLQRSASNGSTFTVRRKPVPGSAAALAAAAATTTTAPSATATAAATSADPEVSASPFADEHAVQVDTAPSSEPVEASEPQEVVVSPSASTTSVAAAAATAEEEDKKEYKLSVDFNIEPLRFSKF